MWYTILTVVHILACLFLILVVLLQTGKGADVGAVFGGSSQTLFGSSGAGNLLTRLTTGIAAVFMLTSLIMTYGAARQTSKSLFDTAPAKPAASESSSKESSEAGAPGETSEVSDPETAAPSGETTPAETSESSAQPTAAAPQAQTNDAPTSSAPSGGKTSQPSGSEEKPSS